MLIRVYAALCQYLKSHFNSAGALEVEGMYDLISYQLDAEEKWDP